MWTPQDPFVACTALLCFVLAGVACSDDVAGDVGNDGGADTTLDGGVPDAPQTDQASADTSDAAGDSPYCPVTDYTACGGSIVGSWSILALCPEDPAAAAALFESPFDDRPACVGGGNETNGRSEIEGVFEFDDAGQVTFATTSTLLVTWVFDDACLEAAGRAGATPEARCDDVSSDRLTCEYAPDACRCVGDPIVEPDEGSGTYTITGDEVVLGDDPPATYCVDGDSLVMDYYLFHPVSWRYWVFERN